MNSASFKHRYAIWLKQAHYDLQAAMVSLENGFYEWSTYQALQAVEKALKATIVHAGEMAPKIHKISVLMSYCNSVNPAFKNTKFSFRHVDSFAFISRYPFLLPDKTKTPHELINKQDATLSISQAKEILRQISAILDKGGTSAKLNLPEPISGENLEKRLMEVREVIVEEFHPEKIILFGSYARKPLPKTLTTIDLLVVAQTDLPFVERIKMLRLLTKGGTPTIEPLVYTPEEFQAMTEEEGESFLESALKEGRVLYSKRG